MLYIFKPTRPRVNLELCAIVHVPYMYMYMCMLATLEGLTHMAIYSVLNIVVFVKRRPVTHSVHVHVHLYNCPYTQPF